MKIKMKTYYFKVAGNKNILSLKANDEDDLKKNVCRVSSGKVLFFSTERKKVASFKEPEPKIEPVKIPDCIYEFMKVTDCDDLDKIFVKNKTLQTEYHKEYFLHMCWGSGGDYHFATEKEVIDTIMEKLTAHEDDAFDLDIYKFPEGNEINYDISITLLK